MDVNNQAESSNEPSIFRTDGVVNIEFVHTWFRDWFFYDLGVRRDLVTLDVQFLEDLGLCSLDRLTLAMEFEDEFEADLEETPTVIFEEDLYNANSIRDVVNILSGRE